MTLPVAEAPVAAAVVGAPPTPAVDVPAAAARRPVRPATVVADVPAIPTPQRAAIDAAFADRRDLRQGLTDNLRALHAETAAATRRVTAAFDGWNPSGLSAKEAERRNFVATDADLPGAQKRILERRLAALGAARPATGITIRKGSTAGALIKDGKGTVKLGPLHDLITGRLDDLTAPPPTPATAVAVAASTAADMIDDIENPPADGPDGKKDGGNGAVPKAVDAFVDLQVRNQMESATSPETRPVFDPIATVSRNDKNQAELQDTFSFRPGPSDVTSVHDFSVLRIAFEHVWTQVLDDEVESLGRELYAEYVGLKDLVGYTAPDITITTIQDLRRLMGEITNLSQIADSGVPPALGGGGGSEETGAGPNQQVKGNKDVENGLRGAGAVATLGASLAVEWAIKEFAKAGQKPLLSWNDVDGGTLNRGDKITATIENGVAAPGAVELVLLTDGNSHKKEFAFQRWFEPSQQFVNVVFVSNYQGAQFIDGGQHISGSATIRTSDLPNGMIEFASEETPSLALGRYVLGGLADRLKDRSRVTFNWQDN